MYSKGRFGGPATVLGAAVLIAPSFSLAAGPRLPLAPGGAEDCIVCNDEWDCAESHHIAPDVQGQHKRAGGSHGFCYEGLCTEPVEIGETTLQPKHPSCISSDLPEFLLALQEGDIESIVAREQKYRAYVRAVPERAAVQLIGCSGWIVAHVTVSQTVLDRFAQ